MVGRTSGLRARAHGSGSQRCVAFEERLRAGLATLPEKERTALLLREMQGLTTAEVARALGSSEVTVRSQISSARLKLRRFFLRREEVIP